MRWLARLLRDRSGAAAAEMALILPLALALIFTMFEGANYLWCEHLVVKGVRDGARYAGRLDFNNYLTSSGGTYSCGGGSLSGATLTQIQNLTRTGQLAGGTPRISGWVNGNVTVSFDCASSTGGLYDGLSGTAPRVTVSTVVTYPSLFSAFGFTAATLKIAAKAQSPVMGL